MTFNDIILWIVAIGVIIGGIDKLIGNRFGLGQKFDDYLPFQSAPTLQEEKIQGCIQAWRP